MTHPDTPVSSVMTPNPITVGPDDTLDHALTILRIHPFRHLPVVQDDELVGILSDRDLLLATGDRSADERMPASLDAPPARPSLVREVMQSQVHTASPETPVSEAAAILHRERIGALPIVVGRPIQGIVTETDLLLAFRDWCRTSREATWSRARVSDHMTRNPVTIELDAPLSDALRLCMESQIRHLPVMHEGHLHGILSDRDIRRGMATAMIEDAKAQAGGKLEVSNASVAEFTTKGVMVISPQSALTAAVFTMATNKIGALPVLDGDALVGVISQTDILACYAGTIQPRR